MGLTWSRWKISNDRGALPFLRLAAESLGRNTALSPLCARSGHRAEDGERSVRIVTLSGTTPETMHRCQPECFAVRSRCS
jgi:hypothetical protein